MRKYLNEIIILLIQMFMFYVFPIFSGPTDAMGLVFLIWVSTIILGIILTLVSNKKIKYLYPIVIAVLFIPSVYIYYNESALIHSVWYLVSSSFGMLLGFIMNVIINSINKK